jgi:hypothetical protein
VWAVDVNSYGEERGKVLTKEGKERDDDIYLIDFLTYYLNPPVAAPC